MAGAGFKGPLLICLLNITLTAKSASHTSQFALKDYVFLQEHGGRAGFVGEKQHQGRSTIHCDIPVRYEAALYFTNVCSIRTSVYIAETIRWSLPLESYFDDHMEQSSNKGVRIDQPPPPQASPARDCNYKHTSTHLRGR